jgi:hypothetical protein
VDSRWSIEAAVAPQDGSETASEDFDKGRRGEGVAPVLRSPQSASGGGGCSQGVDIEISRIGRLEPGVGAHRALLVFVLGSLGKSC